jgi:hypothetical protein
LAGTSEEGVAAAEGSASDPRLDPPQLLFTAPADGSYLIEVSRRLGQAGPAGVYRLEVEPFAGDVRLRPRSDFLTVPRGGTAAIAVDVLRDEYGGPVEVTVSNGPTKVRAATALVPGPQVTQALVTVTTAADATEGASWILVSGQAQIGGETVRRFVDLAPLYDAPPGLRPDQGHFYFLRPIPPVVTRRIALLITTPAPFALEGPEKPLSGKAGSTVTISIRCRRSGGFDGPVALRVEGLPGMPGPAEMGKAKVQGDIPLKIPGNLPPGRYTVVVTGEATINGHKISCAAPALTLDVTP